jgi:hypothetical protein
MYSKLLGAIQEGLFKEITPKDQKDRDSEFQAMPINVGDMVEIQQDTSYFDGATGMVTTIYSSMEMRKHKWLSKPIHVSFGADGCGEYNRNELKKVLY